MLCGLQPKASTVEAQSATNAGTAMATQRLTKTHAVLKKGFDWGPYTEI
jgi:hypothetical protein